MQDRQELGRMLRWHQMLFSLTERRFEEAWTVEPAIEIRDALPVYVLGLKFSLAARVLVCHNCGLYGPQDTFMNKNYGGVCFYLTI